MALCRRLQLQSVANDVQQVMLDEALDLVALAVHHRINAEIQVGCVELEEFTQKVLESAAIVGHDLLLALAPHRQRHLVLRRQIKTDILARCDLLECNVHEGYEVQPAELARQGA